FGLSAGEGWSAWGLANGGGASAAWTGADSGWISVFSEGSWSGWSVSWNSWGACSSASRDSWLCWVSWCGGVSSSWQGAVTLEAPPPISRAVKRRGEISFYSAKLLSAHSCFFLSFTMVAKHVYIILGA